MRAVVRGEQGLECKEVPMPLPLKGQVLIKVFTSPITSSDISKLSQNLSSPCGI